MIERDLLRAYVELAGGHLEYDISKLAHIVVLQSSTAPAGVTHRISFQVDEETKMDDFICQLMLAKAAIEEVGA